MSLNLIPCHTMSLSGLSYHKMSCDILSYHVSVDFSEKFSIKSGGQERRGVGVKYVFLAKLVR